MIQAKIITDVTYIFEYAPESFKVATKTDLASNQVLDTNDPRITVKGTNTVYTLTKSLLISNGLKVSQQENLETLKKFILTRKPVKFVYGSFNVASCIISSLDYEVKGWTEGKPAYVEVDLVLNVTSKGNTIDKPVTTKVTAREAEINTGKVTKYLKIPANAKKYNVIGDFKAVSDRLNIVTIQNRGSIATYKLSDFKI